MSDGVEGMKVFVKILADDSGLNSSLDSAKTKTSGLGQMLGGAMKVGAVAIGAATTAMVAFGKSAIDTGKQFDSSMSQVAATMGTTVDQIGELRDFAQTMGATTAFTASQAADGLNILAMAGYDAEKQMETLPTVLALASAGGMDLAQSADYLTGIMAGFGVEGNQAGKVADYLAKVSASAKGDVSSFGEGLSTVAGMAKTTGQSFEDMTVALGILGNNNFSASEAGNALSRTLKNLYQPTDASAKAMASLGLNAYTATGEARPLQDVLQDLNGKLDGMSDQAKNQILSQIFDAATLKSVPALLNNAGDAWNELSATLADSEGMAQQMADTQLDNLAGDITLFESALDGAKMALSDSMMPALREFVQFGSTSITSLTNAFKLGSGEFFAMFGEVMKQAITRVGKALPSLVSTAVSILSSLGSALKNSAPILFESFKEVLGILVGSVMELAPELLTMGAELLNFLGEGLAEGIPVMLENVLPMLLSFSERLNENAGNFVDAGITMILNLMQGLMDGLPTIIAYVPQIVTNIANIINENAPKILEMGVQLIVMLAQGLWNALPSILENMGNILTALVAVIGAINWLDLGGKIITGIANGLRALGSSLPTTLKGFARDALNGVTRIDWLGLGKNIVNGIIRGIQSIGSNIAGALGGLITGAMDSVKRQFGIASPSKVFRDEVGKWIPLGIAKGITDNTGAVLNAMDELGEASVGEFGFSNEEGEYGGRGNVYQYLTVQSPSQLNPSEVARQTRDANREMVLSLRGV